jgi:hypothetical protein
MNSIQQIFRTHGAAYLERYGDHMPANHRKVIHAICNCGTGAFGQHMFTCGDCGELHSADGSCGNRHCPTCQAGKSDEWLKKQEEKVLPVNYFMVTFTVPKELRDLIRSNQKVCYAALFKAASGAMKKLAKDPRFVGCDTAGFTGILHTWTRQLAYHPHVHFIVPGGGIDKAGTEWKSSGVEFYVHAAPLSKIYRAKFIELLKKEGLVVPPCVWDPDWVIDCRHVGNGKKALKYLAQYVFRVAIAPSRSPTPKCSSNTSAPAKRNGVNANSRSSSSCGAISSMSCRMGSPKCGTTDSWRPTPRCRCKRSASSSARSTSSSSSGCLPGSRKEGSHGSAKAAAGSSVGASLFHARVGRDNVAVILDRGSCRSEPVHKTRSRTSATPNRLSRKRCRTGLPRTGKNRGIDRAP